MDDPVERAVRDLRAGKFEDADAAERAKAADRGDGSASDAESEDAQRRREDAAVSRVLAERALRASGEPKRWGAYLLGGYYLVTPAFLVLEWLTGLQIRVPAFLQEPVHRNTYYGICFAFGILFFLLPRLAGAVALLESSVNIVLVFAIFGKGIADVLTKAAEDPIEFVPTAETFSGDVVAGMLLAMVVWVFAFSCASVVMAKGIAGTLGIGEYSLRRRK